MAHMVELPSRKEKMKNSYFEKLFKKIFEWNCRIQRANVHNKNIAVLNVYTVCIYKNCFLFFKLVLFKQWFYYGITIETFWNFHFWIQYIAKIIMELIPFSTILIIQQFKF